MAAPAIVHITDVQMGPRDGRPGYSRAHFAQFATRPGRTRTNRCGAAPTAYDLRERDVRRGIATGEGFWKGAPTTLCPACLRISGIAEPGR